MKKKLRTFVAVEINAAIRKEAVALIDALSGTMADAKWVEPENLHVTLKFLGDVHEREIAEVCQAVAQGAAQIEPFDLEIRGAGAFPTAARPRAVWLGAGEGESQMIRLHDHIEAALAELGYREEHRRYQTHVTIGRVRGVGPAIAELGRQIAEYAEFEAGRLNVQKVTVFSSELTSDGPIYEVLGRLPLGG